LKLFLQQQGCHAVQGFLLSKPLPADEFTGLLSQPNLRAT